MTEDDGSETIRVSDLKRFVTECFCTIGATRACSDIMCDALVSADLSGHHSHGVFRLDKFIADAHNGNVDIHGEPVIIKESPASAWVDGRNCLGPIVGTFCMKIAMEKAKQVGASVVSVNNSNNFGVASFYSKMALKEGLLGFITSNSSPLMLPTRGKEALSGTNPISLAAPGLFGDYFLFDMATTVTAGGNIEIKYRKGEYLPVGWAMNAACLPETNPDVALKSGRFLPLGSQEELGSYKGTGLSIMVDILSGVLSGSHYSHMVGTWTGRISQQKANVGHCFIVIDPKRFAPDFEVRMTEFMSYMRGLPTDNPNKPVRIPGDRGRGIKKNIEETGGIHYPKFVVEVIKTISTNFKIKCTPFIPKIVKMQMTPSEELAARLAAEKTQVKEVSISETEEDLTVPDNSMIEKGDQSFILEDPSAWMCSMTGFTYEIDRAASLLMEKVSQFSLGTTNKVVESIPEDPPTLGEVVSEMTTEKDTVSSGIKNEEEIEITMDVDGEIRITGSSHDK